jgi:hypothetical protein
MECRQTHIRNFLHVQYVFPIRFGVRCCIRRRHRVGRGRSSSQRQRQAGSTQRLLQSLTLCTQLPARHRLPPCVELGLGKIDEMPHILSMAKRKRKRSKAPWEVIQTTRSPARFIGVFYAADEQTALATAIEQFEITKPHEQKKLMVRPQQ